ncbi:SDR family NAD(P)-dependent oxidoreductase [Tessaracoccus antarcticus]|uniref:SDR family NAD(P)-dependent oxidoreductase n=1 Tax=Tessaracoccus antarcticus TaxID=2479848 RepID=A0A3M0G813_9ACTN|nr:SDR family NAD(P)-dependent oxidoreductase [Tessaracoccus antarcticus]RMB57833.1 SDR family NAD(P)-dependent oxidoreductase [Tessaracoccus antarcticus]
MDIDKKTWLITGASSGIGLALTEAALAAGEYVLGTARRIHRFDALSQRFPEAFIAAQHDVRDVEGAAGVVQNAIESFGRIDVLVNNAGVGQLGAAEEVTDEQLRDMLEQHLFGPAAFVRAVLPAMRQRGSGAIVQMSSQGGRMSFPGVGSYSAGKFALEGWSEALAGEVAPFGLRVLIVEPSRFRTGFNDPDVLVSVAQSSAYDTVLAAVRADLTDVAGRQEGDPERGAAAIRQVLAAEKTPLRLPLGAEAVHNLTGVYRRDLEQVEALAEISASANFPDVLPTRPRSA